LPHTADTGIRGMFVDLAVHTIHMHGCCGFYCTVRPFVTVDLGIGELIYILHISDVDSKIMRFTGYFSL